MKKSKLNSNIYSIMGLVFLSIMAIVALYYYSFDLLCVIALYHCYNICRELSIESYPKNKYLVPDFVVMDWEEMIEVIPELDELKGAQVSAENTKDLLILCTRYANKNDLVLHSYNFKAFVFVKQ